MSEVQSSTQTDGQLAQRFIEFIMVQAQQAAFALGKIPHPSTGETLVNLEAARIFIDHLELLREKTRGNLSQDEETILNKILADLQMTFVQVAAEPSHTTENDMASTSKLEEASEVKEENLEENGKKKFSKSYGA
ncbi:MAG: DUF1844 domain-containing protein [Verrucomicrobia bacterium]|nr:DUF1844 domain-containing protein [Verrucomicrobiota bacterium]